MVEDGGRIRATESGRRSLIAASLMTTVLMIGTTGYIVLGLGFADALYQTAITVTTVGFGEITPNGDDPSAAYRWFTLILVMLGAMAVLFAAGVMIEGMIEARAGLFQEKRMQRDIDQLSGHIIICGFGRVGRAVARRANGLGGDIVVIDASADQLKRCPHLHIVGDGASDETLRRAGVERAESLVAALSSDADNLFVAVSAQQLNTKIRVVSRANAADAAHKLRAIALDTVVEPYEMAGSRLATAALRPHTSEYLDQVFSTESDKVELTEVEVGSSSELAGSSLAAAEVASGVVIVACRRRGEHDFHSPSAFVGPLQQGDIVIVLGDRDSVLKLSEIAMGAAAAASRSLRGRRSAPGGRPFDTGD